MKKLFLFSLLCLVSVYVHAQCGFSINANNVTYCNAAIGGTIDVNVIGGIAPITYQLNNGLPQAGNQFNNVLAGTYTVYVTDATPCTDSVIVTSTQSPAMIFNLNTITQPSCVPGCDGMVTTLIAGGVPAFTYTISGGGTIDLSGTASNLCAGTTYTIVCTDANNCSASTSISPAAPTAPSISILSSTDVSCNGMCDGTAQVAATGGVPPYTYAITAPGVGNALTGFFTSLCAGIYTVTVADVNGCIGTTTVLISEPAPISSSFATFYNVFCNGACDGAVEILVAGGTPGYTFNITGPGAPSGTYYPMFNIYYIQNLCAGSYVVQITDTNLCTYNVNFVITEPPPLHIDSVVATNVLCNGNCNGSVYVYASGGATPYTYSATGWIIPWQASPVISNLCASMYTIQVSDANGCNATSTSIITQPALLTISNATFSNPTCLGINDGTITLSAAGGTPAYTYTLLPGAVVAANGQFGNLSAGAYTIVVSDAYNCTVSTVLNLSPPALNFTMNTLSNLYCNCAGSVEIANIGGGLAPYNYTISPVANQPMPGTFDNMCGGSYTITVTDINSCSGSTVIIANQIQLSNTSTNSQCNGVDNGSIICTPSLGAPPYTFTLNPGNIINATGIFNNLAAGIYTIGVVDANACSNSLVDTISDINNINLTMNLDTIICGVQGPSYFFPNGGAGGGAYTYTVMPGNIVQNINLYTNLNAGNYTVTINNPAGCIKVAPFDIIQLSGLLPTAVNSAVVDESCYMAGDGAIDIIPANPFGLTYQWNNNMVTQDLVNITSGSYMVKISDINGDCTVLNANVNSLGINCGTVSGHIFHDANSNCQQDPGENDANNVHLSLSNGALAVTNNAGDYQFSNVPYGSYSIIQNNNILFVPNACAQPNSVTLNALNNNIQNVDFKDSTMTYTDAAVQITCLPLVPGFNAGYSVIVVNNSFNPVTGNLWFKLNNGLILNSTYPTNQGVYPVVGADSIIWNNINIPAYSFLSFYIDGSVTANLPIGILIQCDANFDVTNFPDYNLANNHYQFQSLVQGAFDPNNKSVNPVGEGPNGNITLQDSVLDYLIRFQNTGTDSAHNIFILDTLSDKLDITTLKITAFSHPYKIEILNGHILKFKFDHIMLPDSNVNEPLSHGYIAYRIQQKNTNQIGDVIHNTASIHFDFNAPVVTNTTVNTIEIPNTVKSLTKENNMVVYPNPASDKLNIQFDGYASEIATIIFCNKLGQIVKSVQVKTIAGSNKIELSVNDLAKGIYLLKISNGKNKMRQKVLIE